MSVSYFLLADKTWVASDPNISFSVNVAKKSINPFK